MKRLTDKRTAEALRSNAEGLTAKDFDVPIDDLRYIKLADYENEEERKECFFVNDNTCVCCGVQIPEGRQICPKCEKDGDIRKDTNVSAREDDKSRRCEEGI